MYSQNRKTDQTPAASPLTTRLAHLPYERSGSTNHSTEVISHASYFTNRSGTGISVCAGADGAVLEFPHTGHRGYDDGRLFRPRHSGIRHNGCGRASIPSRFRLPCLQASAPDLLPHFSRPVSACRPFLAGIITNMGLYTINLMVMGWSANVSLLKTETIFSLLPENRYRG